MNSLGVDKCKVGAYDAGIAQFNEAKGEVLWHAQ